MLAVDKILNIRSNLLVGQNGVVEVEPVKKIGIGENKAYNNKVKHLQNRLQLVDDAVVVDI